MEKKIYNNIHITSHIGKHQIVICTSEVTYTWILCYLSVEYRDWTKTDVDRTRNLALEKPTNQSSTSDPKHASSKAVDGNVNSDARKHSFTSTKGATGGSWWEVNLEAVYQIREVVITSRGDCCRKFAHTALGLTCTNLSN